MDLLPQIVANGIIAGAIYTMIAIGFNLIFSTVKFFDIGYGVFTVVGGYSAFTFSRILGWPFWLSVILGTLVAGFLGWIVYMLVYYPLRKRKASVTVLLVASFGVFILLQAIVAMIFTSQFRTLSVGSGKTVEIFGAILTHTQILIFVCGIALTAIIAMVMKWTLAGRAVQAVGDDEDVSKIVGINTSKVIGAVIFCGSAIGGLAGILVGMDTGIEPTMGMALLLKGVISAIIGGVGNVYGGIAGAFLLGFVENFGIWQISGEWKDAIAFVILIIFLLWRPRGIFPR